MDDDPFIGFSETERNLIRSKANGMNHTEYMDQRQSWNAKVLKSDMDQRNKIVR